MDIDDDQIYESSPGMAAVEKALADLKWDEAEPDPVSFDDDIEKRDVPETISEFAYHTGETPRDATAEDAIDQNTKVETADEQKPEGEEEKKPDEQPPAEQKTEAAKNGEDKPAEEGEQPKPESETAPDAEQKPANEIAWTDHGFDADTAKIMAALPAEQATRIAGDLGEMNAIKQIRSDYAARYKARGIDVHEVPLAHHVAALVRLDDMANSDPAAYVKWFVGKVGMKPEDVVKAIGYEPPAPAPAADQKDDDYLNWLKDDDEDEETPPAPAKPAQPAAAAPAAQPAAPAQPSAPEFNPNMPSQVERDAAAERFVASLTSWGEEKGEDGQLKRPHLQTVSKTFHALMAERIKENNRQGKNTGVDDFNDVYETSIYSDSGLRASILEAERKKAEAEIAAQAAKARSSEGKDRIEKAERANRSGSGNPAPGGRTTGAAPKPDASPFDIVRHTMEQMGGFD